MRGIMFKAPLFNAVIEGRKKQTRRVVMKLEGDPNDLGRFSNNWFWKVTSMDFWSFSRYKVGEKVYLKEPYWDYGFYHSTKKTKSGGQKWISYFNWLKNIDRHYVYRSDFVPHYTPKLNAVPKMPVNFQWKKANKMFMPEKHARYFIEIKGVRVERVQDISDQDIKKEGVKISIHNHWPEVQNKWIKLWDSINKPPYTWEQNPFVWVYEFKLIQS